MFHTDAGEWVRSGGAFCLSCARAKQPCAARAEGAGVHDDASLYAEAAEKTHVVVLADKSVSYHMHI